MNRSKNPYPQFLIDEVSGIEVPNQKHQIWEEGYKARKRNRQVINTVMKSEKGMVLVFDEDGEQMPEYQGQYEEVMERILRGAPPGAVFSHITGNSLKAVPREEW